MTTHPHLEGLIAGWISDPDTIPKPIINTCRDAICREFGENGTDGYYKRILAKVFQALAALPGGGDYAGEVVNFTNGMTASGPPMTIIAAKPLPYGTKLYTAHRVTGGRAELREALERFVRDAEEVDVGGGDAVVTTCESLEIAKAALQAANGGGEK